MRKELRDHRARESGGRRDRPEERRPPLSPERASLSPAGSSLIAGSSFRVPGAREISTEVPGDQGFPFATPPGPLEARRIPCTFPADQGIEPERRVRRRLRPPPSSLRLRGSVTRGAHQQQKFPPLSRGLGAGCPKRPNRRPALGAWAPRLSGNRLPRRFGRFGLPPGGCLASGLQHVSRSPVGPSAPPSPRGDSRASSATLTIACSR